MPGLIREQIPHPDAERPGDRGQVLDIESDPAGHPTREVGLPHSGAFRQLRLGHDPAADQQYPDLLDHLILQWSLCHRYPVIHSRDCYSDDE
jgi:hypothetical protein